FHQQNPLIIAVQNNPKSLPSLHLTFNPKLTSVTPPNKAAAVPRINKPTRGVASAPFNFLLTWQIRLDKLFPIRGKRKNS
ncbi:MAG: hypothetical protein WBN53_11260, partial [Thermodesulfobacteriota bacterium]